MRYLSFDNDNSSIFSIRPGNKQNFAHHVNTFPFAFLHGHEDYWEFTILTKGHLENVTNGETIEYEPDTVFYSTTGDVHKLISSNKSEDLNYINIIVRESRLVPILNSFSHNFYDQLKENKKSYILPEARIVDIERILRRIHTLDTSEGQKYDDYLCSALMLILQYIFFQNIEQNESENPWVNILNKKMQNMSFLSYNVEQLCNDLKCSRMHLNRFMKQHFNITPHQFLLNYKLSYAHNCLLSTDMTIKQIFETIGYDSFSSFSKNFKEKYGDTPYKFKQNHKI